MNWIKRHFDKYLERGPWGFCWRIGLESLVVSIPVAVLLVLIFGPGKRASIDLPVLVMFLLLLVIAPPLETLVFQAFPIFIVRLLKGSFRIQIIASAVLFSAAHFTEGVTTGISAGLIGGLYFGFAYAHWRTKSRWQPFWITTVCHIIHNGIAFILLVASGALK
jgi:hypothetical protein